MLTRQIFYGNCYPYCDLVREKCPLITSTHCDIDLYSCVLEMINYRDYLLLNPKKYYCRNFLPKITPYFSNASLQKQLYWILFLQSRSRPEF